MTATQTEREVARWLGDLSNLTAGNPSLPNSKARVASLARALAAEFDRDCFTGNSLTFVARRCNFFPSFAEACEALAAWRAEHPRRQAIAAPEHDTNQQQREKIQAEHDAAEESWRNISEPAIFAKVRALNDHPMRLILGRILATAVRRHQPRMLGLLPPEFLTANDDRSAA